MYRSMHLKWRTLALLALACLYPLPTAFGAEPSGQTPKPRLITTREHRIPNAQSVAFSPDGELVAGAFGGPAKRRFPLTPTSGGIAVWKTATGERVQFVGEYGDVVSLTFTANSQSLLYGRIYTPGDSVDDDIICLVNITQGRKFCPWGRFGRWHVCAASPSADLLLLEKDNSIAHIVSQRELESDAAEGVRLAFEDSHSPRCAAFAPNGSCFAVVHSQLEPVRDAEGNERQDVRRIRCKCLTLFDSATLSPRSRITSDELEDCYAVTVGSRGTWIATGHPAGVVRVWNSLKETRSYTLQVPAVGYARPLFSPDGQQLAILVQASSSRTWKYADTPSGFQFGESRDGSQPEVVFYETGTFSPTQHWRFADGIFRTWHADTPRAALNPERIAFSTDGKHLLIGAGGVTLVDITTGKIVRQFDVQ